MSVAAAQLFRWVQAATFYIDVHRDAVALVAATEAATWLDVGCGPGLLARLAAERGFAVIGIDRDPAMIRFATRQTTTARFEVGDLADLGTESADIVSAASLLCVVPDPAGTATSLWAALRPGGSLLVVETASAMTIANARRVAPYLPRRHRHALHLWALVRQGHALDPAILDHLPTHDRRTVPLLHGLIDATLLTKPSEPLAAESLGHRSGRPMSR
jgi:2-polyprenyl-3-methyl-5-hydroxy-6-metoxy-1,4-benzoquinol methylase